MWHRLFGAELPIQGVARPCAVAIPPDWKSWQRPSSPFARCAFDVQIEEALSRGGCGFRQRLEIKGVRCLYLEVRAEIRRWFWDIELAHGGYIERNKIAEKLRLLLDTSSEALRALEKMGDVISYLSSFEFPHDQDKFDATTKIWELYDEEIFDHRISDIVEYILNLSGPTERYIKYYSPLDQGRQNGGSKRRGRKRGVGIDIRRRLFGINGMALFSFLKEAFPGETNRSFEGFLSELEHVFFADEDTMAQFPSEAPLANQKDIRSLADNTVRLLKEIGSVERHQLVPKDFEGLQRTRNFLRERFEENVWNSWEETASGLWPHQPGARDPS
ncbi:MAG: hypothetical protein RDA78_28520 [Roseibium sp.]|uniref:hypothetical protein n=1 Tax=Roseibium sp. TaxID=1936156 RepID=UPI003D9C1A99